MNKTVFMLEDDTDDRYITRETLEELNITVPVQFFNSSNALFETLAAGEIPSLILLDYNTVPENGIQVLKQLKAKPGYASIPVVILSDSDQPFFRDECYRFGASSYIKKPSSFEGTHQKIGTFFKYWMEVAEVQMSS